jgi:hypothetical protein
MLRKAPNGHLVGRIDFEDSTQLGDLQDAMNLFAGFKNFNFTGMWTPTSSPTPALSMEFTSLKLRMLLGSATLE